MDLEFTKHEHKVSGQKGTSKQTSTLYILHFDFISFGLIASPNIKSKATKYT